MMTFPDSNPPQQPDACPVCGAYGEWPCVKISASARSWAIERDGRMAGVPKKMPHPERRSSP